MKREFEPLIDMQDELMGQLHHILQGGIMVFIQQFLDGGRSDLNNKSQHETQSMKITKNTLPKVYNLCKEVQNTLGFEEDIDFYMCSDNTINAYAILSDGNGIPHIININSGLFNIMNEAELKSIIGHEIGHLMHNDGLIDQMINLVYPEKELCPPFIKRRVDLYNQLAELSADRCGYLACRDLDACISANYKLTSGVNVLEQGATINSLIKDNEERLDFVNEVGLTCLSTHPFISLRIKALRLFAEAKTDEELDIKMASLIEHLQSFGTSQEDQYMMQFMVSAGLMIANADGNVSREEKALIIEKLGEKLLAPVEFFEEIEKKDISKVFNNSVKALVKANCQEEMLKYVIEIAMEDGLISEDEIKFIFDFGKMIKVPQEVVISMIGFQLRESFRPSGINLYDFRDSGEECGEDEESLDGESVDENPGNTTEEDDSEEENKVRFAMQLEEKFTKRDAGLVVVGFPIEGEIHVGDEVVLTNKEKVIEDVVAAIVYDRSMHDSYFCTGNDDQIGILLTKVSSRSISGDISNWFLLVE